MRYEDLIKTISEIVENEEIYKNGLTLVYELDEKNHEKMDEHLFYKANPNGANFQHKDVVEVEIADVKVKFIKKSLDN
jgi:hypothetical protein